MTPLHDPFRLRAEAETLTYFFGGLSLAMAFEGEPVCFQNTKKRVCWVKNTLATEQWKRPKRLFRGFVGDEILPGIITNHYKDPFLRGSTNFPSLKELGLQVVCKSVAKRNLKFPSGKLT